MPTESNRQVAERITETAFAEGYSLVIWRKAIEAALNAERERCAKIAEERGTVFYALRQKEHSPYDPKDLIFGQDVCDKIAAAIRGSKQKCL